LWRKLGKNRITKVMTVKGGLPGRWKGKPKGKGRSGEDTPIKK
jgi:hypothetical protein